MFYKALQNEFSSTFLSSSTSATFSSYAGAGDSDNNDEIGSMVWCGIVLKDY